MPNANFRNREPGSGQSSEKQADVARGPENPWFVNRLNDLGRILRACNVHLFNFGDSLVREFDSAVSKNPKWGSGVESDAIRTALDAFSRGIDDNPHLTSFARLIMKRSALANLRNRRDWIQFI